VAYRRSGGLVRVVARWWVAVCGEGVTSTTGGTGAGTACQEEDVGRCQDEKEGGGVMRFPYQSHRILV
jgi:hypothetical protein